MIFKSLIGLSFLIASLVSASANASTIFAPTDGNVNFLNTNIDLSSGNTQVAIFNVGDLGGANNTVVLDNVYSASLAEFSVSGGNYLVSSKANISATAFDNMTLFGTDNFILGLTNDSGTNWVADIGYTSLGGSLYDVHFADGSLLQVDVQVVPVPAAVWLFGSGLIGLAGIARRKAS
jgi:hypothetical protein